jgi:hypothetical protein
MSAVKKMTFEMKFNGIKIINFSQSNLELEYDKNIKPKVEFRTDFSFGVFPDESKLSCLLTIKVLLPEQNEEFAELKVEFSFKIKPFDEIVKVKGDDSYEIPDAVMHNLASISVSSARGILFEKLRGTALQNEIFPLVNPANLFGQKKQ